MCFVLNAVRVSSTIVHPQERVSLAFFYLTVDTPVLRDWPYGTTCVVNSRVQWRMRRRDGWEGLRGNCI